MAMGHQDQERANICSTKNTPPETTDPLEKETDIPEQDPRNRRTYGIYLAVEEITGNIYTNQMDRLPIKSIQGNIYVMILFDYD